VSTPLSAPIWEAAKIAIREVFKTEKIVMYAAIEAHEERYALYIKGVMEDVKSVTHEPFVVVHAKAAKEQAITVWATTLGPRQR
jgi:hypothetical protein